MPSRTLRGRPCQDFVAMDLVGEHAAEPAVRHRDEKSTLQPPVPQKPPVLLSAAGRVLEVDDIVGTAVAIEVDLAHGLGRKSDLAAAYHLATRGRTHS